MNPYYSHAGIEIYHGDSRDILPHLLDTVGRFDLLLTDPPYGIGASRRNFYGPSARHHVSGLLAGKTTVSRRDYGDNEWDDAPVEDHLLEFAMSLCDKQIVWGGNYFKLPPARCMLVWDKLRGETDFADGELAWTNLDRAVRIFRWRWNGFLQQEGGKEERVHPTQKPVPLMKWCIAQAGGASSILDPFMGSGPVLEAAKALGISAVGIEIHEPYCEIAAQRLAQGVLDFGDAAIVQPEEHPFGMREAEGSRPSGGLFDDGNSKPDD